MALSPDRCDLDLPRLPVVDRLVVLPQILLAEMAGDLVFVYKMGNSVGKGDVLATIDVPWPLLTKPTAPQSASNARDSWR